MIVVFGSINMDLVARLDHHPAAGETVLATAFERHHGGKGGNQAAAAARLGAPTRMIGAVGEDAFGPELVRGLRDDGVDTSGVTVLGDASGVAMITVDAAGENRIVVVAGANARFTSRMLSAEWFAGADVLLMQLEVPLETVRRAARLGRDRGARVLLNAAPAQSLSVDDLADVDVLIVNEGEAGAVLGRPAPSTLGEAHELARALAERVKGVVITLGALGAVWRIDGASGHQRSFPSTVVDTTAAGDAFVGALAQGLAMALPVEESMRRACAAGALATRTRGARPSLPGPSAVQKLLAEEGG